MSNDTIADCWEQSWEDAETGIFECRADAVLWLGRAEGKPSSLPNLIYRRFDLNRIRRSIPMITGKFRGSGDRHSDENDAARPRP
jgi:hypothetical protein